MRHLPPGIKVHGALIIRNCPALMELPAMLEVGKDVLVESCPRLARLPDYWHIRGSLGLIDCGSITHLPRRLTVDGNLDVQRCPRLRYVGAGFRVGGDVDMTNCAALTNFEEDASIGGALLLADCTMLEGLPEEFSLGGSAELRGCASLRTLPGALLRAADYRFVDLRGSGITGDILTLYSRAAAPTVDFLVGPHDEERLALDAEAHQAPESFADLAAAWQFWSEAAMVPATAAPPLMDVDDLQLRNLLQFAFRLSSIADGRNERTRPALAARVLEFMRNMASSSEASALCHACIADALVSCDDGIAMGMNQIELGLRLHHAETSDDPEGSLWTLGMALARLDEVHKLAVAKVKSLAARDADPDGPEAYPVDPVEVYLAYETGVAALVELPVSTHTMLFFGVSEVTEEDIAAAGRAAQAVDTDAAKRDEFFAGWGPWQKLQRHKQAAACTWDSLPRAPHGIAVRYDDLCIFTQYTLAELRQDGEKVVVVQGDAGRWSVFGFDQLLEWWSKRGTHPVNGGNLALSDIYALPASS